MHAEAPMEQELCFLSYSRGDERFALRFAEDLRSRGAEMWVDQLNIRPSEHWDRAIERAIHACEAMVVILSPRAVKSDNVADEVTLALDSGKPIIPVMIQPCRLPLRLARMHLIDATSMYEAAVTQCLAAIQATSKPGEKLLAAEDVPHDQESLRAVQVKLATLVGPIAGILVEKAAIRATSIDDLYGMLSLHIDDVEDREQFLSATPRTNNYSPVGSDVQTDSPKAISPDDIQRVARALTRFLGPIAPLVAKRESLTSRSRSELLNRVAATIRCDEERADFCRLVEFV
jgi:hypothetical protein